MITFYYILNGISILLILVLFVGFILYLSKNYRNKTVIKTVLLRLLGFVLLIGLPIYFINSYWGHRLGQDFRIEYNSTITSYSSNDSLNLEGHYNNVMSFNSYIERERRHVNRPYSTFYMEGESQRIIREYSSYKSSPDTIKQDIGHLFLALHYVNLKRAPSTTQFELDAISDTSMMYFNYVQGVNYLNSHDPNYLNSAERHLKRSIERDECTGRSYKQLANLYWYFHKQQQLNDLMDNPSSAVFVPEWMKRARFFGENNWIDYWKVRFSYEINEWQYISALSALILLSLWIHFLRKLDIYEPEKKRFLVLTFFISIVSMQLLYPMHDLLWYSFEYYRPSAPISDLWYCIISIGMIEELVKIIPVLLILKITKAINEPFDYILYASVSALGFAFIENIGYFSESISNVPGRGIYCCISHMAFSATIGYGLMLAQYRGYNKYFMFILSFILASFLHGFYDFWIIDWWASEYVWVSSLTFVVSIHLWFLYINNTLNSTVFYDRSISLKTDKLKHLMLMICVGILMTGYIATGIVYSVGFANEFLVSKSYYLSFFIFYLIITSGSMKIIRGYISPVTLPLIGLLKNSKKLTDLSGNHFELSTSKKFNIDTKLLNETDLLNQEITLLERMVINGNLNSYTIELSQELNLSEFENKLLVAIPHWDISSFKDRKKILTNLFLIKDKSVLDEPFLTEDHLTYLGKVFSKRTT